MSYAMEKTEIGSRRHNGNFGVGSNRGIATGVTLCVFGDTWNSSLLLKKKRECFWNVSYASLNNFE